MTDDTIRRFYAAFAQRDWRSMGSCYADDVHFTDPVFDLHGDAARAMWRMLCERGSDLRIEASGIEASGDRGRAHWDAWYTFSTTGRPVHNVIDAEFTLRDGLIVRHVDRFDFWRWSRQALGAPGVLLGWSGALRRKVQGNARIALDGFVARAGGARAKPD